MALNFAAVIVLARVWWAFMVRGALAIVFGLIALLFPGIGLVAILALFAAWALIGGATEIIGAWRMRGQKQWWVGILEGLASVAAGVVAVVWPQITAIALLYVVAGWAIVTGIMQIWLAIRLRERIQGELLMVVAGVVSIGFGILLVANPGSGLLGVLWLVGIFAVVLGGTMILFGWRLRRVFEQATRQHEYAERGLTG